MLEDGGGKWLPFLVALYLTQARDGTLNAGSERVVWAPTLEHALKGFLALQL